MNRKRTEIPGGRSKLIKDIAGHSAADDLRRTTAASVGRPFAHSAGRAEPPRDQCAFNGASLRTETFGLVLSGTSFNVVTPERTSRPGLFSETDTLR